MLALRFPFFRRERVAEAAVPEQTESVGLTELTGAGRVCDAFPSVRHIAVNLSIRSPDNEIEPSLNNRSFGPQSRACFFFRCKNVDCVDGGFDLEEELTTAIAAGRTSVTGRRLCQGWRNRDCVGHRRCYFELNFKIHISYDDDTQVPATG